MKDECLICGAPLKYLEDDELMECAICHKKENSKTACVNGHYVCNECHTQGMDSIIGVCLAESSKNPIEIIQKRGGCRQGSDGRGRALGDPYTRQAFLHRWRGSRDT